MSLARTLRDPVRGRVGMREGRGLGWTAGEVEREEAGVGISRSKGRGVEYVRGRPDLGVVSGASES